jgi:hypothetical protein
MAGGGGCTGGGGRGDARASCASPLGTPLPDTIELGIGIYCYGASYSYRCLYPSMEPYFLTKSLQVLFHIIL